MMSNGPVLVPQVVEQPRSRDDSPPSTSSAPRRTCTLRKPSRCRPRSDAAQLVALAADDVRAEVAVGPAGVALRRRPARARRARSRPAARRARGPARPAACAPRGCTLVASTTVSRPAAQPLAGDVVQHVEGVAGGRLVVLVVGDQRRGRSREESTSVGAKCARGEGRLARAGDADERRPGVSVGDASARSVVLGHRSSPAPRVKTAIWVGGPTSGSSAPTGANAHRVAVARARRRSAQAANSARVHSNRWSRCRIAPAGSALVAHVVLDVRRGHDDRARAGARRRRRARARAAAAGRRARSTSISTAAS